MTFEKLLKSFWRIITQHQTVGIVEIIQILYASNNNRTKATKIETNQNELRA